MAFLQNYTFFLKKVCLINETFVINLRLPIKGKNILYSYIIFFIIFFYFKV